MRNCFLLLFIFLLSHDLLAQKVSLKKQLTAEDLSYLKKQALSCFDYEGTLQLTCSTTDLQSCEVTPDKPCSMKDIARLRKELEKKPEDALLNSNISAIYKRLGMPQEGEPYKTKAIQLLQATIEAHPDSADAINILGGIYMSDNKINESLEMFRLALSKKPTDSTATTLIAFLHLASGQFDSAYAFIQSQTTKYPESFSYYTILPSYYFYKTAYTVMAAGSNDNPDKKTYEALDSTTDMSLLRNYYERNKNDIKRELLYRTAIQAYRSTKVLFSTMLDTAFDFKNIKFNLQGNDKAAILESEKFFLSCLKRKDVPNLYIVNKLLGNIYLLLDDPKKALPYLKKTIALKPISKSTLSNNASEDYDNLAAAYFILKDTSAYEKILLDKYTLRPAIDPNAHDHVIAARVYVYRKNYVEARKIYEAALQLDKNCAEAWLGIAALNWLEGNSKNAFYAIDRMYEIDSNNWKLYFLYGVMMLEKNDATNAYASFIKAKELNGNDKTWINTDILDNYFNY
ncbi:MAG: tetratricopeptide repeat protein [Bacteroidia bacterium]